MTTRREFLTGSTLLSAAVAASGIAGAPKFSFGQSTGGKTFIKIFMRGGADGLHLLPAIGDTSPEGYYFIRPDIAIPPPNQQDANSAIQLAPNAFRGLNPNLEPLMEIWDAGNMAISPAAAIVNGNRSHFDCQRWIGTGVNSNNFDGYLNRFMQEIPGTGHALRGVAAGRSSIPTELLGDVVVPAISSSTGFDITNNDFCSGNGCADNQLTDMMREISSHDVDLSAAEGMAKESQIVMLEAIEEVKAAGLDYTPSAGGLDYSGSGLGRGLRLMAQLLKAGVPVEVASLDFNIGWDTHSNQISDTADRFIDQSKNYHRRMREGATDLLCFYRDMGVEMSNIVLLIGSEFGRTARQNGSMGTDHGRGGAWFAIGGPSVQGFGRDVASLDDEGRGGGDRRNNAVPEVVNYRDIVSEIMVRHLGVPEGMISTIFPGHTFTNENMFSSLS